ncbi:gluconokinase [Subtercola frigoramans]|uniref:Gluconokinase n=1 Tax=Subtercola frigoramans TaxID=120298 RepID=A0ABS2L6S7_9MICO|nr:gluconokinase [Subtercola frigoramans]MBM7472699.1 gluconokinase [Subtercola frigoramans]
MTPLIEGQPIIVVMGVSGSGKSTIAAGLADELGWDFEDGDNLHSDENVAKMSAGIPLDDADRQPWLETISSWIVEHEMAGVPGVITCSALKRRYRDVLRERDVVFVHLAGSRGLIGDRLTQRSDHYMPPALLDSQLDSLEPPEPSENAITVNAEKTPAEEVAEIVAVLALRRR